MSWDDEWVELKNGDRVRKDDVIHYNKRMGKAVYRLRNDSGINYTEETLEEFDEAMGRIFVFGRPPRFIAGGLFNPEWLFSIDGTKVGGAVVYNYPFKVGGIIEIDGEKFCVSTVVNHFDSEEGWRCRIEFRNFKELT